MTRAAVQAWNVDAAGFPQQGTTAEQLEFLLRYAVLAPSSHNTQPWWFRIDDGVVEIHADRGRALPVVDPDDRELTISCGAALGHLEIALRRFSHRPDVQLLPEGGGPDLLARIAPGPVEEPRGEDIALFEAIPLRHTNREPYADRPVPGSALSRCRKRAGRFGVELCCVDEPEPKRQIAGLVEEGDRLQFADKRFRRELAAWIRSQGLGNRDGISGAGLGLPDILSAAGGLVVRTFDMGDGVAAADRDKIAAGSPCLLAFATEGDDPRWWLETGRALSHVLLALTVSGLSASYLNQPIEVESLRPRLRETLGLSGWPQLLLRAGRGKRVPPSARRPLRDVLLTDPD